MRPCWRRPSAPPPPRNSGPSRTGPSTSWSATPTAACWKRWPARWRCIAGPPGRTTPKWPGAWRDRLSLARNLGGQGRFEEAAELFASLAALGPELAPNAGFEWAEALRRAGRTDEARLRALEALERWSKDSLPAPRAGLARALGHASSGAQSASLLPAVMEKLRKELGVGEDGPGPALPDLIAALASDEAARSGEAPHPCDPDDPRQPREVRAQALLAQAAVRDGADQPDCLDAALKLLEEASGPQDARLVPLLKQAAEKRKERAPAKAEAALRRAIALLETAREPEGADLLELRTLLGLHLLQQGRPEEGAGILEAAFERGTAGFRATKRELEAGGSLVLALLQAAEEDLRYDRALSLAQRAAAVLEPLREVPEEARRDLEKLLRKLERQAKLQQLLGPAWPG